MRFPFFLGRDLTNQTQTFENQIQYFLLKMKVGFELRNLLANLLYNSCFIAFYQEEALDKFIGKFHPECDKSHTKVKPWQQRAHLKSAYIYMLGDELGLEAVEAGQAAVS